MPASSMCSITPPRYSSVAVEQRVDIDLDRVFQEPVHQHRMLRRDLRCPADVVAQGVVVVDDLHPATAEHVAGPHQHRIADLVG